MVNRQAQCFLHEAFRIVYCVSCCELVFVLDLLFVSANGASAYLHA